MTYDAWSGGIDAQSGCRLPLPHRANLDARGQAAMDRQMDPARGSLVGLRGPTGIRLHSPFLAEHAQALVDYFRRDSTLDPRTQEIAILATARSNDSEFEWAAHAPAALQAGVSAQTIDVIRRQSSLESLDNDDRLIVRIARQLFAERRLDDVLYGEAIARFGSKKLVELISFMAMYAGTAYLLAAFDMQLPDGAEPAFTVDAD